MRLIGTRADGWLPSLASLQPGDLERGYRMIDEAALAAGRDPRSIERLLNIGPDLGVDQIVDLTVTQRISTFVLASDDEATLRRFAGETIPAVQDRVAG